MKNLVMVLSVALMLGACGCKMIKNDCYGEERYFIF